MSTYLSDRGIATKVRYAFFARSGFTEEAVAEAQKRDVILVDLELLGKVLE